MNHFPIYGKTSAVEVVFMGTSAWVFSFYPATLAANVLRSSRSLSSGCLRYLGSLIWLPHALWWYINLQKWPVLRYMVTNSRNTWSIWCCVHITSRFGALLFHQNHFWGVLLVLLQTTWVFTLVRGSSNSRLHDQTQHPEFVSYVHIFLTQWTTMP